MPKIHFLDVGCADTTIIKAHEDTILIDCYNIEKYSQYLPKNKSINAVFITHQHYDHFTGLEFLKTNNYSIQYLIYSPYQRRHNDNSVEYEEWNQFNNLVSYFSNKGSKIYKPFRQDSFEKPWWNNAGFKFWIIGPEKSIATKETRELHDASLVLTVQSALTNRQCCFTGDASDESLNWIAQNTSNYCNDILHASHHGSINGADLEFIKKSNIKETIISTESGVHENVPHPTAIKRYKDNSSKNIYRTDIEGTIIWDF
jgi:beta-lactamase superfamily II metal-dependent hydrolase